ncbi:hypothetical protein N7478_011700 [Penicillium angulare]|uniref:uncharacterized protein n=1 Tax=Penicillium angulare TaxID=116970 RepID=UPI00253FA9C2|nr:uncharacterized protein N7478_011700 [Penicillium angulare]KAJ5261105.1 hypothetical protein N7478_011700 [Penicillium angulare]
MASTSSGGENYGIQIGDNRGSIYAEFHPPKRPETPPGPLSNVPFPRDPDFVARDTLLNQLHNKSLAPGTRIALVGLGGVGKSLLASEYTYRVRSESPGTWVFWAHASNEARFEQSFRDIADELKLPGRRDSGVNVFQLMENWLREEKHGRWICVIDNVDDDFLCSLPAAKKDHKSQGLANTLTKPLIQYVPRRPHGFTILTSRSREIALKMVNDKDLIDVQQMERFEALDLFQRKMDQPEDIKECQQLVETLELMPLAIVQAASYIRHRAPRYSVSQYLSDLRSDREATELLQEEIRHTYRDWEASNSILLTWQTSFQYISQIRPSAADLLSLMSFFDRQGITAHLVQPDYSSKAISPAEVGSDSSDSESSTSDIYVAFEKDVDTLRDFSLISVNEGGTSFIMHRLVQLSTRAWLKSNKQEEQWKEKFIKSLAKDFPSGDYETWEQCRALYPHVKSAISQRPKSRECQTTLSGLLYRGAWYAFGLGLFGDMEEMASKSKKLRIKLLGHRSEVALESTAMLAIAYRSQGRCEDAERLEVQVMETHKTKLGKEHPDMLASMANLAATYRNQGRWEEAELLEVQVMETHKTKLSEDHPDTLKSMANLAATYRNQGRWEETAELEVQVMETRKTKLGEDHPSTLTSMANLASTYWNQGRWEEAEQLFVQVIETSKMTLGEDHPSTLTSMANLASMYWDQDRWEEAEQLEVQVMETRKTKLGEDHPDTLTSMGNLAMTWKTLGHDVKAIDLLRNCLTKQREKLGSSHPDTLSSSQTLLAWETDELTISS